MSARGSHQQRFYIYPILKRMIVRNILLTLMTLYCVSLSLHAQSNRQLTPYVNQFNPHAEVRRSPGGMILAGRGDSLYVMAPFMGSATGGEWHAQAVNAYKEAVGDSVRVYCMVIPTSTAYYMPQHLPSLTHPQHATISHIYQALRSDVVAINAYGVLASHASEPIYLRTDTHWAALGAYYAAQEFAAQAGVPFVPLATDYEERYVHQFVGSMRIYAKTAEVKDVPEVFTYYVPRRTDYHTTFIDYTQRAGKTVSESAPHEAQFFVNYRDGSSGAYCTFMGGDSRTVQVRTAVGNGRRLLILKDSFGNALPAFLFSSFEEIHVVDFRYFPHNILDYMREHGISDVLFANNIGHAYSQGTARTYLKLLQQ